jgi:hypothetical protein
MTVSEAIEELKRIQIMGYGHATLRSYSELGPETYRQSTIILHMDADNENFYPEYYGDWVEVL